MGKLLNVHPVAALFPRLADDELEELAADIKERGLLQPIVLDADGAILDGRNRLAACEKAGVKPEFVTFEGDDPGGYALSVNINRRHLKASARHLIAEMARRLTGCAKLHTAQEGGIDRSRLAEAAIVLDFAPDLTEKIFAGGMTLQQAADTARMRKREAAETSSKMARLKGAALDLHELVQDDAMDIDEALGALDVREEKARAEAEATASEERRAAHERSVELGTCIKLGEESAASIVGRFVGDVSAIISAHTLLDEAGRCPWRKDHPAASDDKR